MGLLMIVFGRMGCGRGGLRDFRRLSVVVFMARTLRSFQSFRVFGGWVMGLMILGGVGMGEEVGKVEFSEQEVALWEREGRRWERQMKAFEEEDAAGTLPERALLLIGSSTFALWKTAAEDLAPFPVINRGYGGAKYSDHYVHLDQLLGKHRPQAIVLFAGNDREKSAEKVRDLVVAIRERIEAKLPGTPVFIIGGRQFPAWSDDDERRRVLGELLWQDCQARADTWFIPFRTVLMGVDGRPREGFFVKDGIHLTRETNVILGAVIKSQIEAALGLFEGAATEGP